jgi:Xaa-Pro aminopeptidase
MSRALYQRRRRALLAEMPPDSLLLLPAAGEAVRSRDVDHPFRQDSDLLYLTGFPEPDALALLAPGRKGGEFVLFCRPHDPEKETWNGARAGLEGAIADYRAAEAHPIAELDERMPALLEGRNRVYYPLGRDPAFDRRLMDWLAVVRAKVRGGVRAPSELVASDRLLHERRLVKDAAELRTMRRAARISAGAHRRAMQHCRPGLWEYQLEAVLVHHCADRGARFQAYPPIVGSGANACVLHYVDNGHRLRDGDLVLIDAGCELDGYASDITRTFPVNGRFTAPQRELYELVLAAQAAAIAKAVPGNRWNDPHDAAVRTLTAGLVELGILSGTRRSVPKLIREGRYKPFYMHRTGHWLGMDVHDVGDYRVGDDWRRFEPGMVLTVEPGLYIAAGNAEAPPAYRDIGIRIEDDVAITDDGHEILTAEAPKDPLAIEALVGTRA